MLRILSGGKCAVSEQEMYVQVEKNEIRLWVERADLATVCLTAVKLQMFGDKTRHVCHPIRTCLRYYIKETNYSGRKVARVNARHARHEQPQHKLLTVKLTGELFKLT